MEIWKDIEEFNGLYQVSNTGKIKSIERFRSNGSGIQLQKEKIRFPRQLNSGYLSVNLWKDNKQYSRTVHKLVAEAFILNPENKATVNHKDGNKLNCNDWNLEWSTYSENINHAIKTGLNKTRKGKKNKHNGR